MGTYTIFSSEIGGRAPLGAWALKRQNTVFLQTVQRPEPVSMAAKMYVI